jgi:hypothetical protein
VALYFDNFPADRVKPSGATLGGQIKLIAKQISFEQLQELIPILANASKPISAAWCNWAKDQIQPKTPAQPATPIPPRFVEEERKDVVPMPEGFRDAFRKALKDV